MGRCSSSTAGGSEGVVFVWVIGGVEDFFVSPTTSIFSSAIMENIWPHDSKNFTRAEERVMKFCRSERDTVLIGNKRISCPYIFTPERLKLLRSHMTSAVVWGKSAL